MNFVRLHMPIKNNSFKTLTHNGMCVKLRKIDHVTLSAYEKSEPQASAFFLWHYAKRGGDEKRGTTG
jgi:hypothetical protein